MPLPEAHQHAFIYSQYQEPRFHFYWHYHEEIELVFVRQGDGLRYIGRSVEPSRSGELIMLGSNLPHTWGSSASQLREARWTVVQFSPARWGPTLWNLPELKILYKLFKQAECGIQFVGGNVQQIGELMESIGALAPMSFDAFAILIQIFRLLLDADRRVLNASPAPWAGPSDDPRLQFVLSLIDKQADDKLSQARLSTEVNMAPAVFSRWFKQHMGRTFQHYVNEVRIARVCARLVNSDENITTAAMASGFQNLANFNRRFLAITNLTPREFRTKAQLMLKTRPSRMVLRDGLRGWLEVV